MNMAFFIFTDACRKVSYNCGFYNLGFMESKTNYGKGSNIIGVNPELDIYINAPCFKKAAEEGLEFLLKHGVPEEIMPEFEAAIAKADKSIQERYARYKSLRQTNPSSTPSPYSPHTS